MCNNQIAGQHITTKIFIQYAQMTVALAKEGQSLDGDVPT